MPGVAARVEKELAMRDLHPVSAEDSPALQGVYEGFSHMREGEGWRHRV